MFKLVYSSVETESFDDAALKKLLRTSRIRNHAVGVTGMLIYDAGVFLQALEGEGAAVMEVFKRIESDRRHRGVTVLARDQALTERSFGQWSMGFSDASGAAAMLRGFVSLKDGLKTPVLDRTNADKILRQFAA